MPLLNNDGSFVAWLSEADARRLIRERKVHLLHTKKRVRAVRVIEEVVTPTKPAAVRRRGVGDSHKRDARDNPAGVWTIDRIPRSLRPVFRQVVTECMTKAA